MKNPVVIFLLLAGQTVVAQELTGTSNPLMIEVGKKPTPSETKAPAQISPADLGLTNIPPYYALIIGVSDYRFTGPGLPNLDMPVKDAERLYSILTTRYAFKQEHVTLLKNPTREEIINQMDHLASVVTDKDNLLVFYAGHGYYDKSKEFGYWLPSDAKKTSTSAWISNSQIKDYMGAIKSKHTLLITDACFGGSIFKTRSVETMIRKFYDLYHDQSRKALTSGNLSEVPDQSIFIKYLLKVLEESSDPFLPASILFARIYEPVSNNAPVAPQFGVIQGAGDEGGDFIFIKNN
ncbi:MAG: caspase domain-containing protein [Cyclobacteriaceae bacterium]